MVRKDERHIVDVYEIKTEMSILAEMCKENFHGVMVGQRQVSHQISYI